MEIGCGALVQRARVQKNPVWSPTPFHSEWCSRKEDEERRLNDHSVGTND
jgi:hypothetical protein